MDEGPMIPPINPSAEDEDMEDRIEALIQKTDTAYASEQSPQAKDYFKKCCEDALDQELKLLPYSQILVLKKDVYHTADDSDDVPNVDKNQQKYAGIMNLEKYYNKTNNSPAHLVSMSNGYFILALNPCIKDEYFNVTWTKDGQQQALTVMEKVFDKYCQRYSKETTTSMNLPTPELGISKSSNGFGSLMSRVTEGQRAHKKLVTKDVYTKLKLCIEEPLTINDQWISLEHQAEHIFEWWKANVM
ncbi:uncharacterized protein F5891DRAFT_981479 [Suillus fuscotomentosus]|uniref:Uncharacterized protein n=1 Tax=Suillus fuscotomentosus TaxID=1912939 RepID=A0AAD4E395_9AGAM|nr:uncharacterized protein F5891DRAFT_981479 [Suillus fuscotomentosus]KAG1898807.1 hypothetical protein F5891DRAFT_981479 [Suillus fuscotomentosus]